VRASALALLWIVVLAAPLCGQQRKTCLIVLDNADRQMTTNSLLPGNTIVDVAGNVRMHCERQKVSLRTDSLSMLSGDYARLYGHAVYQDSSYQFAADTIIYLTRTEKVEGRGHVVVLDKTTGSTLVGPFVDYWRQAKGINDSAKVVALLHPTVRYFARATPKDTARERPYLLTGQMLQGFGGSRLWGSGGVTVDRDSLHGTGDSLAFQRGGTSVGQLIGVPATLRRNGTDSFMVSGHEIRLGLVDDKLRDLHAFGGGRVTRGISVITGDTVVLSFAAEKLSLTLAWGKTSGATLHSSGYDVRGDSLSVESPGELLRELRVKNGTIFNPRDSVAVAAAPVPLPGDSTKPDTTRNYLSGNRLLAHFDQADSAGTVITRLKGLEAFGRAASYFGRTVVKNGKATPSINYTLADTIFVLMKSGDTTGVSAVRAYGHVNGLQLETASLRKKNDSTKVTVPGARP
jgi:hypothetical protein